MGSNYYNDCDSPGFQGDNFAIYGQEKSFFFFSQPRSQEECVTSQRTSYRRLDGWHGFKEGNIKTSKYVTYMSVTIKR